MFIIFDSSNQLFDQLIKTKKKSNQQNSRLSPNPMGFIGRQVVPISDERYPTYGMDIPNSCKIIRNHLRLIVEIDL